MIRTALLILCLTGLAAGEPATPTAQRIGVLDITAVLRQTGVIEKHSADFEKEAEATKKQVESLEKQIKLADADRGIYEKTDPKYRELSRRIKVLENEGDLLRKDMQIRLDYLQSKAINDGFELLRTELAEFAKTRQLDLVLMRLVSAPKLSALPVVAQTVGPTDTTSILIGEYQVLYAKDELDITKDFIATLIQKYPKKPKEEPSKPAFDVNSFKGMPNAEVKPADPAKKPGE